MCVREREVRKIVRFWIEYLHSFTEFTVSKNSRYGCRIAPTDLEEKKEKNRRDLFSDKILISE